MIMKTLLLLSSRAQALQTFKFSGNPYSSRTDLSRTVGKVRTQEDDNEASPFFTDYVFPEQRGKYPFFLFLTGFYGMAPEFTYDEMLSDFAKKGWIIAASTTLNHREDKKNETVWDDMWDWHLEHAQHVISEGDRHNIEIDFDRIVLGCQSAGCETLKYFANTKTDKISAFWMLDPVPMLNDAGKETVYHEVTSSAAVMIESTEFCGPCCIGKWANEPLFNSFVSSDVKMFEDQLHTGHCSCLNTLDAKMCGFMCNAGEEDDEHYNGRNYLRKVHACDAGKVTAFFADALWNDSKMRDYYQNSNEHCGIEVVDELTRKCQGPKCLGW